MTSMIKNIIVMLGLVALAAVGYYLFIADRAAELKNGSGSISSTEIETRAFLNRLEELQSIQLSGNIFNDKRFRSLQDYSQTVIPSAVGRVNPFEVPGTISTN